MTTSSPALAALDCPSRRGVLRTLAGIGVGTIAAGVLVACGAAGSEDSDAPAGDAGASEGASAESSVPLADVPVGEAVVVDALGARFVVAQPTEGEVVAYSASCTHAGTNVDANGGLELLCPNHGSRFDATDGSATKGPATEALTQVQARIEGDMVILSA